MFQPGLITSSSAVLYFLTPLHFNILFSDFTIHLILIDMYDFHILLSTVTKCNIFFDYITFTELTEFGLLTHKGLHGLVW